MLVKEEIGNALRTVRISTSQYACLTGTVDRTKGQLAVRTANVHAHREGLYYGGFAHKCMIGRDYQR